MGGNIVESLIGAVVLAVAGVFLYVAYTTTELGTAGGYPLTARFERVGGLTVGSDVRVSGLKVGTVTQQQLDDQTFEAVVQFSVDKGIKLPSEGTFASITSEGLLGDTYLSISPGGIWPGDEPSYLQAGDQIEHTESPMDLFGLIAKAIYTGDNGDTGEEGLE